MTNKTGIEILNIMIASDDLKLYELVKAFEDFFVENNHQILRNDPVGILQIVYCNQIFNNIQKFCLKTICLEPEILFESVNYTNLPAPLLEIILRRDDLNLDKIEVWNYLIKWGLAQERTLSADVSNWRQEDFNVFKRILYKFIPLIRFDSISSEDYFNQVRPYEEILSKELRENIVKFYMVPGYKLLKSYDDNNSILIDQKLITIFANWIDKKVGKNVRYTKEIPYKFNLLYRASRDGNTAAAFHEKCDNMGATIVVAKITNSEQIIGGYNPLCWDSSNSDQSTKDSFIFSFANRNNLRNGKAGYSNGNKYSIQCYSASGPLFGYGDLYHCGNYWCSTSSFLNSYPRLGIPKKFNVDDYEVFQIFNIRYSTF
jgi:hypothetical protein